ncbi:MAG: alpha/beta fold hydrolase [Nocardioidaceae bacterium]
MAIISWRRAAALGVTVAGAAAAGVVAQVGTDRGRSRRRAQQGDDAVFGSLHSAAQQIEASDGVLLNVEVDEPDGDVAAGTPTVVFVHGWVLDLNCWHYQRAALRGRARLVFYDQRSHGRSGRSPAASSTHEQLGRDLRTVLESVAPDGPVVLVGHSMGGITVMALADEFPELFDDRVVAVALLSTSAGELVGAVNPIGRLQPLLMGGLARMTFFVDKTRNINQYQLTRSLAVGPDAAEIYADMAHEMISRARTHVFWDFSPSFASLDLYPALAVIPGEHTVVIAGTKDQLTPIRHSRILAERIKGSTLVVCERAGHMVMLEAHEKVNHALDVLLEDVLR